MMSFDVGSHSEHNLYTPLGIKLHTLPAIKSGISLVMDYSFRNI
jgi:hypothetical protein